MRRLHKIVDDGVTRGVCCSTQDLNTADAEVRKFSGKLSAVHFLTCPAHLCRTLSSPALPLREVTRPAYFFLVKFQHITPLLRQLHWLKAPERIAFKYAVLVYKCFHGSAVCTMHISYRRALSGGRCRGSSATPTPFRAPDSLPSVGDRAFPVAAGGTVCLILSLPRLP